MVQGNKAKEMINRIMTAKAKRRLEEQLADIKNKLVVKERLNEIEREKKKAEIQD
jgi:hypothetical protein